MYFPGVFGQSEKWNIHRPQTFQHPMIPYDVLIDPQSLPDHPIMSSSEDTLDEDILDVSKTFIDNFN